MNERRSATPFSVLRSDTKGVEFHFELDSSVFLAATADDGRCAGFFLPNAEIASTRFRSLVTETVSLLSLPGGKISWKIIGESDAVDRAQKALSLSGQSHFEKRPRSGKTEILFTPSSGRVRAAASGLTRVLIVDDSPTIRNLLRRILSEDPGIEIVGVAGKPSEAEAFLRSCSASNLPHVITLDIHMPEMDGVSFLRSYLPKYPIPTVMISSISLEEGPLVLSALESGAVDYIQKPSLDQLASAKPAIIEKVKHARFCKVRLNSGSRSSRTTNGKRGEQRPLGAQGGVVAIGSSTGGTEALREIFARLPREIPPIVVTQHIPPFFSKAFAKRMDELCPFEVKEAEDGDTLVSNRILIAPGGTQMSVMRSGSTYRIRVDPNAPEKNRHKPSVDVLFESIAPLFGARAIGVILTGMGSDGANGLLKLRKAGASTLGQDEASCVVYGMPRAALEIGAVERQITLDEIAGTILELLKDRQKAA